MLTETLHRLFHILGRIIVLDVALGDMMSGQNSHRATRHGPVFVRDSGGEGLPLVMLHGWGFSGAVFDRQFDSALAGAARLIAIDLPGHGASADAEDPEMDYTARALSESVFDAVTGLGVRRAAFFGWAMGGHVAMELLGTTSLVAGLAVSGAAPVSRGLIGLIRGMPIGRELMLSRKAHLAETQAARYAALCIGTHDIRRHIGDIERADGRCRIVFGQSLISGDGIDQRVAVEKADVPVAMINGSDDHGVRKAYLAGLHYRSLWGGVCHLIPDGGHAPFMTRPDAFNALLGHFVADVAATAAQSQQNLLQVA